MTDQNTFMETLQSVKEIIKVAETPMSEQEIMEYFKDMELNDEHKKLVFEYLLTAEETEDARADTEEASFADTGEKETKASYAEEAKEGAASKALRFYQADLAGLPRTSKEEEAHLYTRLLQGEEEAVSILSTLWLSDVVKAAEKYMEPKLHMEDLIQEGNMALLLKLQELCGAGGERNVRELLMTGIEAGIADYAARSRGEWELENTVLGKVSLVHEAGKLLAEENGREPTMKELSDYTKIPMDELMELEDFIKKAGEKKGVSL